jgi:hypothetical protein
LRRCLQRFGYRVVRDGVLVVSRDAALVERFVADTGGAPAVACGLCLNAAQPRDNSEMAAFQQPDEAGSAASQTAAQDESTDRVRGDGSEPSSWRAPTPGTMLRTSTTLFVASS